MNATEELQESELASCRRLLIEEGKMVLTDAGYQLTELGQKAVQKELRRYELRPAMLVMIETYVLNVRQCAFWD